MKILINTRKAIFQLFFFLALSISNSFASIDIIERDGAFLISSGKYSWQISKTKLNVINKAATDKGIVISGGEVSVDFLGSSSVFGAPSESFSGNDWVEVRGWADKRKNLWYIARYQFYDNKPLIGLSFTVTDRHDKTKTEGQWDAAWKERKISNLHIKLNSTSKLPTKAYKQYSSHSGASKTDSFVEIISRTGSPYKWKKSGRHEFRSSYQLEHSNVGAGDNKVVWHLKHNGEASLEAMIKPFSGGSAYLTAKNISYIIKHANGTEKIKISSQNKMRISLGKYTLDQNSTVTLLDDGTGGILLAGAIRLKTADGSSDKIIRIGTQLTDNVLQTQPLTLIVQSLWKNHPIEVYSSSQNIGVKAIPKPTILMGGMGKTFDIGINIDGNAEDALALFNAPPSTAVDLSSWNPIDGYITQSPEYLRVLKNVGNIVNTKDILNDNFGWKNWGDYQIGTSYVDSKGRPIEDWASLQIDLPTGLLLAWLNTKDPQLWLRAKAAVRHAMDIDIVKYMPFRDKFSGAMHRKGGCPVTESHVCTEPVFDYSFGWRGLLLYHFITGEKWAKDIAQMQIDNSAYIAKTRKNFLLHGGRPAAWVLRALIYGAKYFPEGTRYLSRYTETPMAAGSSYRSILDNVMKDLIPQIILAKKFPGHQPVWAGQGIETLAEYHKLSGDANAKLALTLSVDYLIASTREGDGTLEVMYNENNQKWVAVSNYGWLWLSSLAYAYEITQDQKYLVFANKLYKTSVKNNQHVNRIRGLTSVISFPWLYVKNFL